MSRDQVLGGIWYMQDILEMEIAGRGTNISMTYMSNLHTCAVGHVYLIMPVVLVPDGELIELAGDVI